MGEKPVKRPVIVSACLLGLKTRYDGGSATDDAVVDASRDAIFIPVCPEQLGGLPTPRPRAEITQGNGAEVLGGTSRVLDELGKDISTELLNGAEAVAGIAGITGAVEAYLKEKSPSCGVETICRGGEEVEGSGVTTALLKAKGLVVKGF
jgi:uncharacterized protein YbbK (DUF523 family)